MQAKRFNNKHSQDILLRCFCSLLCRCISGQRSLIKWDAFWADAMFKAFLFIQFNENCFTRLQLLLAFSLLLSCQFAENLSNAVRICVFLALHVSVCVPRKSKFLFSGQRSERKGRRMKFLYSHHARLWSPLWDIFAVF